MHDIRSIRENPAAFDQGSGTGAWSPCRAADRPRRPAQGAISALQAARSAATRSRRRSARPRQEGRGAGAGADGRGRPASRRRCRSWRRPSAWPRGAVEALAAIPNMPKDEVPVGADEHGNVERHRVGKPRHVEQRQAAFRDRRGPRPDGLRDGREALGLALRRAQGRACAAGAGARPVHDRPAHRPSTATRK